MKQYEYGKDYFYFLYGLSVVIAGFVLIFAVTPLVTILWAMVYMIAKIVIATVNWDINMFDMHSGLTCSDVGNVTVPIGIAAIGIGTVLTLCLGVIDIILFIIKKIKGIEKP